MKRNKDITYLFLYILNLILSSVITGFISFYCFPSLLAKNEFIFSLVYILLTFAFFITFVSVFFVIRNKLKQR